MQINQREFSGEADKRAMATLVQAFPAGNLRGGLGLSPQLYSSPLDFASLKMSWCIAKTGDLARRGLRRTIEHEWGHLLEIAERLGKPIV